ncbi:MULTISPECIES: septal ring lytic transglycosylase RlpA family protein [Chryseobacterium]|uniref:Probable endolytic peptidoglycan transglycosylase RlpA n=2 Tax=Chryseobacterium TaxID=59732 RepID=A0A1I4WEX6_CHROL|nr:MULTISPECIES: septal ring lytic transglycosylase RlpA family protein [Chryseobacterium]KFF18023.1 lipoprotein [Chryseobacterium sp. JM1]MCT2564637.1 septal ring lytic transglycosylase RlpA family protein [Chryseobacterium sp. pc1-10]SFN11766.1 rare lipoprotein A [Chryseobacterium oleae]SHE75055.1 rare lipoprotein A [Chryseobacterium sp. OV279]HCA07596.1 septal ring lytic transglycosylase RlpA family protein [Chryseobacterium sp.]
MMKRFILVIIMMISTLGVYSFTGNTLDAKKTSYASYYHDKFNGRKTASGEIFSNSKFTAANRTLPFGTNIRVTNLNNGKQVIVKINDRGPFHASRALDISKAAFDEIGDISHGTIPVEYEIVD